ncbi:cytochrome P450 family protein [Streptomyces sp. NPDC002537]
MNDTGTAPKLLLGEELVSPLHPVYDGLSADAPVREALVPDGYRVWLVTRYDEARAVLADPRVAKDMYRAGELYKRLTGEERPIIGGALTRHMLNFDPPDHTRLRTLVNKAFTARMVERLRPKIEELTEELLDSLTGRDEIDLVWDYAFPLPISVICELLGVPRADRPLFRTWAEKQAELLDPRAAEAVTDDMTAYLRGLIHDKRERPADDLLTALIQARDNEDRLDETELVGMAYLLLKAGFETTVNLIGSGVLRLLCNPDQLAALRADPGLLPGAVDELLRYEGPAVMSMLRFTTEPITVGDIPIPAGEFILVSMRAANRDPARYPDPERFDIKRDAGGHLGFGHGIHYCVGAPVGRLEAEIAVGRLLERFPDLALAAAPETLTWMDATLLRGLLGLPVSLGRPVQTPTKGGNTR